MCAQYITLSIMHKSNEAAQTGNNLFTKIWSDHDPSPGIWTMRGQFSERF